ncbi:hypothetical protein [Glycomyces niveus]|uniref:Uncharacterized protein n=1 Tax=Glycomyces niveus TaxID=2820287 RepID=A0ABS3U522_9ACTN|nr:hypothetical protein [Glycomyces sp. NEAU-S30]MBO3733351.1 hypothetical protein [Glycomyces sp. NEAU-S30]
MSARRWAAGLGGATVLALTAGCGMLGIGGGEEKQSDEQRLVEMLNESRRLESELMAAEYRIVQNCLEAQGHTVHEPWAMEVYEEPETDSLTYGYAHEEFLLPAEEAKEWGFGQWANSMEGSEDPSSEDYYKAQEEKWAEEEGETDYEEPDTSEWDALTPEEQYSWYVAYQGEEYVKESYGTLEEFVGAVEEEAAYEEMTEEELAALEEEAAAEESGEIDVEEDMGWEEPKPGGCQLEMIEALYGEPRLVETEWEAEEGETYTDKTWEYRPENPLYSDPEETMYETIEAEYTAAMADLQGKFIDCITARGYEGWEFTEYNSLPIWEFFGALYYQNASEEEKDMMYGGDSDVEVPEIPEAAGSTYEEWKAYEIQTAVDFSECGEEIGYADASEKAYDEANIKGYKTMEEPVYAWQEEMNNAIAKAQEVLDN